MATEQSQTYFAYGSNMDLEQMKRRCLGGYEVLGVGKLPDWRFFINSRGYANIIRQKESQVLGLIFDITPRALLSLDRYEGYPRLYTRNRLQVLYGDEKITPIAYIDKHNLETGEPWQGYLEKIIQSAKRFAFPEEYVRHLESFQ